MKRAIIAAVALMVPACASDGHLDFLGYTTRPNFDTKYKTVRVNMVKSRSQYAVTPTIGMAEDLHRALITQIGLRTPYRVVHCDADTELSVKIRSVNKNLLNMTQQNNIREAEIRVEAELVWRDLKTGKVLTRPGRRPNEAPPSEERQPLLDELPLVPSRPDAPVIRADEEPIIDPATRRPVVPVIARASGYYRPELGESTTSGQWEAINQIAVQIIQQLESPWTTAPCKP
jgi:hypothetical protein